MRMYKQTEILRATASQEVRQILGPEQEAPSHKCYREVQLLMPDAPVTYVTISSDPHLDKKKGLNRTYKLPIVPPGAQVTVRLSPDQMLWAAADEALSHMTLVVEYIEP